MGSQTVGIVEPVVLAQAVEAGVGTKSTAIGLWQDWVLCFSGWGLRDLRKKEGIQQQH